MSVPKHTMLRLAEKRDLCNFLIDKEIKNQAASFII